MAARVFSIHRSFLACLRNYRRWCNSNMRKPYFLHLNGHVHAIPCSSASVISEGLSVSNQIKRAGSNRAASLTANMVKEVNTVSEQVSTDKPEEKKYIYCIWPSTDKHSLNLKINLLYWSCAHALTSLCDCRLDYSLCHLQMPFYLHRLRQQYGCVSNSTLATWVQESVYCVHKSRHLYGPGSKFSLAS